MNRKMALILGLVAVIFVAALSIGVISAADSHEVTIKGEKFNIPDGYRQEGAPITTGDTVSYEYMNNAGDIIMINVNTSPGEVVDVALNPGEVKKTINGVEGNYDSSTHMFTYKNGNTIISIQAPNEQIIGEVMGGGGFLNFNF